MDKPSTAQPALTLRRGLVAVLIAVCTAAVGTVVARALLAAFHGAAAWVLPAVVVGTIALLLVGVLTLLPLYSRRT